MELIKIEVNFSFCYWVLIVKNWLINVDIRKTGKETHKIVFAVSKGKTLKNKVGSIKHIVKPDKVIIISNRFFILLLLLD